MRWIFAVVFVVAGVLQVIVPMREKKKYLENFPQSWKKILEGKVNFYRSLSEEGKRLFEKKVRLFLYEISIKGIQTNVTDEDKLLVASSAVIPVFYFDNWKYRNLNEVLLYPAAVKNIYRRRKVIVGMVGTGRLAGKMFLSKPALHKGFEYERDGRNVGIHEFVHLIDMADGIADGIP